MSQFVKKNSLFFKNPNIKSTNIKWRDPTFKPTWWDDEIIDWVSIPYGGLLSGTTKIEPLRQMVKKCCDYLDIEYHDQGEYETGWTEEFDYRFVY